MAKKIKKPRPENYVKFDEYMQKWRVKLNLQNWRVEKIDGFVNALAAVSIHPEDRLAVYKVGRTFGFDDVSDKELETTAIHELLHVMLNEYQCAVKTGSDEIIMSSEHGIIAVLEGLLIQKEQ